MAAPSPTTLDELRTAISTVVDYLWEPELIDYRMSRPEMSDPETHVFHMLVALNNWVHGLNADPDQLVDDLEETYLVVNCKFCNRNVPASTAHLHDGYWVGDECCWDELLRSTE